MAVDLIWEPIQHQQVEAVVMEDDQLAKVMIRVAFQKHNENQWAYESIVHALLLILEYKITRKIYFLKRIYCNNLSRENIKIYHFDSL